MCRNIRKTRLYNFDPLKPPPHTPLPPPPHTLLYSKTGVLQGYTLFYLVLLANIDCGYSLEPPRRGSDKNMSI